MTRENIEKWVRIGEALKRTYRLGKIIKVNIKQRDYKRPADKEA